MARSWHYPRWRRVLMQVTLWVIFGGTVAMAAWVVRQRRPAGIAGEWGPTISVGGISISLPAGWEPMPGDSPDVLLQASEHTDESPDAYDQDLAGRTLIVQQFAAAANESAEQFLTTGGPLKDAVVIVGGTRQVDEGPSEKSIKVDTAPGVMLETLRATPALPGQTATRVHEWIACAIEPTGDKAIVLRLQRFGGEHTEPGAETDDAVLARVASAIRFSHQTPALRKMF